MEDPEGKETKRHATFGTETSEDASKGSRERWSSRLAFYLAAIGSAIGFGNIWRFPAQAKDYGGGAFFIPYFIALLVIGIPVLVLEISLGQFHQTGNVGVFGTFHARCRGVGVSAVACAYMLAVYYSMLLSWVTRAFFDSWSPEAPWTDEGVTGEQAVTYFTNDIIGMETLGPDLRPTRIVWPNVGYSVLSWLIVWACLAFGLKWTGRIAYFSMGLPIVLLFVFLGRACTLPGASEGIKAYAGQWDLSVLSDRPDVWSAAVSQVFFSLSVTFGTMTAYGSGCPRGEPAFLNAVVVGGSDTAFSIIVGLAVFAAMGHLAYQEGVPVDEIPYAGFSLVFGTWPVVFGSLPGGAHWVRLLFFDLFLLGVDSAFSILEAPLTVILDRQDMQNFPKWKMAGILSILAWLLSFIYATDAGLIFLDSVDFYINFVILLVGFFETFGAGWVYGIEQQVAKLGPAIVFVYMFTNFGSVVVASGLWFGLDPKNAVWGGFVALFVCYFAGIALTGFLLSKKISQEPETWTWRSITYELCLKNVMDLRQELTEVVGYMPWLWAFGMKCCIPHILLILFVNLAQSSNADGQPQFGHYGGYVTWPYQVLGILCVVFAACLVLVGIPMPQVYEQYDIPYWKALEAKTNLATKDVEGMESETNDAHPDEDVEEEAAGEVELEPPVEDAKNSVH